MCFEKETNAVQSWILLQILLFTVRRPFCRKYFKWKNGYGVWGSFLRKRKFCRQNFNRKYWKYWFWSYYSGSSHREVLCNRLFCNVTCKCKKYQSEGSVHAFPQTCFIKGFNLELEEQLLVAAYWLLLIDGCYFYLLKLFIYSFTASYSKSMKIY